MQQKESRICDISVSWCPVTSASWLHKSEMSYCVVAGIFQALPQTSEGQSLRRHYERVSTRETPQDWRKQDKKDIPCKYKPNISWYSNKVEFKRGSNSYITYPAHLGWSPNVSALWFLATVPSLICSEGINVKPGHFAHPATLFKGAIFQHQTSGFLFHFSNSFSHSTGFCTRHGARY